MCRLILLASGLVLTLCFATSLAAQNLAIQPGTRIRVTLGGVAAKPFVGVVEELRGDSLSLRMSSQSAAAIATDRIWRLEVSQGKRRPMWSKTAPLWMPVAGFGLGALLGYSTEDDTDDDYEVFGRGVLVAVVGALGGVVGLVAGVGTAIGVKTEHWRAIPLDTTPQPSSSPTVYVAPSSHGLKIGLRAKF